MILGGATIRQIVLGYKREQAEQLLGSKPVSSVTPSFYLGFCLKVPALFEHLSFCPDILR